MNIFEKLLEIRTGKTSLEIKYIFLDKEKTSCKVSYYYDTTSHTLYINWLKLENINQRKVLENVINKLYNQELNELYNQELNESEDTIYSISKTKKPKAFLVYYSDNRKYIIIDKIELRAIRNKKMKILKLKVWS